MTWLHWATIWDSNPAIWGLGALAIIGYRWLPGAKRDRKAALWVLGVLVLLVSLQSALNVIADDDLFTAHMAQHLLLSMLGPPLMIGGLPSETVDALIGGPGRRVVTFVVSPFFAGPAYFVVLVLWHWPPFFDYGQVHSSVLMLQHLSFIAVGLLFWWAVLIHRPNERWNLSDLGEVAYLTAGALPAVVVGLTVALLPHPVYLFYLHRSIHLGLGPLADQRIGGLLMFICDNALMAVVAGWYLWHLFPVDGADEARLHVKS